MTTLKTQLKTSILKSCDSQAYEYVYAAGPVDQAPIACLLYTLHVITVTEKIFVAWY